MEKTWWNQIPNAKAVIDNIVDIVAEDRNSVIIKSSSTIPWYNAMHYIIADEIANSNSEVVLEELYDYEEIPGKILLEKFCKQEKKNAYRNSKGYAAFLAESDDIVLNDRIIWITNTDQRRAEEWIKFIRSYSQALKGKIGGNFILEVKEFPDNNNFKGVVHVDVDKEISEYDYFLFNMLVVSRINLSTELRLYLSELVRSICGSDLKLSSICISEGVYIDFMNNPYQTLLNIVSEYGEDVVIIKNERQCEQDIWNSQIRRIFPVLEEYRRNFIRKYYDKLSGLRLYNAQQEFIDDPYNIELGTLSYAVGNGLFSITQQEYDKLTLFKDARNSLAHINTLSFETVKKILA